MSDPLGLINPSHGPSHIGGLQPGQPLGKASEAYTGPGFKDLLMKNIEQVNKLQQDAEFAIEDLATGRRDDVDGVMIAKQKADIAFQMMLQVRNKLMDAYEEVKQIRV